MKKYLIVVLCVILVVALGITVTVAANNIPPEDVKPITVADGISVMPEVKDKVTQEEIDGYIKDFGTDSNVIIYDVVE